MEIGPKSVGFELKPGCAACVGPARASLEVTAAYIILSAPSKYLGKCRFDPLVWEEGWGGTSWSLRSHRHPQMAQNNRGWRRGSSSCWGWGGERPIPSGRKARFVQGDGAEIASSSTSGHSWGGHPLRFSSPPFPQAPPPSSHPSRQGAVGLSPSPDTSSAV